jgi:probable 2-oxoglutarate dehydrogenase E1 component DHKTD1
MPHRGRLNLLTDLLSYPPTALFHKIKGGAEIPDGLGAEGDVISHLGNSLRTIIPILLTPASATSATLQYGDSQDAMKVSLIPNPSHLG